MDAVKIGDCKYYRDKKRSTLFGTGAVGSQIRDSMVVDEVLVSLVTEAEIPVDLGEACALSSRG